MDMAFVTEQQSFIFVGLTMTGPPVTVGAVAAVTGMLSFSHTFSVIGQLQEQHPPLQEQLPLRYGIYDTVPVMRMSQT